MANHKKIYVVLILCIAVIFSTIILSAKPKMPVDTTEAVVSLDTTAYDPVSTATSSKGWTNLLNKVATGNASTTDALPEDATLTAKLAKDIFARYLQVASKDHSVTEQETTDIVNSLLSTPEYTDGIRGAVYVKSNLHVVAEGTPETLKKYSDAVNAIFEGGMSQIKTKNSIAFIINDALISQDPQKIVGLDTFVKGTKYVLDNLLKMNVPSDLVSLHLQLVNSVSNIYSDVQSMRETFNDPVRGYLGANKYPVDTDQSQAVIVKISNYILSKTR